ncbi:TcmI family type II polyketide cyclase [Streptomyces sp. ICN988]|uniref:TcmI family type II polyketide cyclase n=1 Tax=unclassified Streptomyces TaxID=2593676 RepID=UPI0021E4501F|nr:TcmI family type II polyketide cyclase [Streptomyces sp. ICN988]MCV2461737.1 TcmI family type II polyketide cyclase [Streptomyces sp. ICN988]
MSETNKKSRGTTLIVARMDAENSSEVSRLFSASDATSLPHDLGVRGRRLFRYHGLYFHLVEFDGTHTDPVSVARGRADFQRLSEELSPFVLPFEPATWRGPESAMAEEFYSWTAAPAVPPRPAG